MTKKIATILLFFAVVCHIQAGGWLPREAKLLGDGLLLTVSIMLLLGRKTEARLPGSGSILSRWAAFAFAAFTVFTLFRSIYLWGDPVLTLRWSRRWLIACVYFMLIAADGGRFLHTKLLRLGMLGLTGLLIFNVHLTLLGVNLPGREVSSVIAMHGMDEVTKIFLPGTLILYFCAIWSLRLMQKARWLGIAAGYCGVALASMLIPFRGWFIASAAALFIAHSLHAVVRDGRRAIVTVIVLLCGLGLVISTAELGHSLTAWTESAWEDLSTFEGSIGYRYERDVTRLLAMRDMGNPLLIWLGVGFVPAQGAGEEFLGFSSETNDSGWVEVLLTGGYAGGIILTLLAMLFLWRFASSYVSTHRTEYLVLFTVWLASAALMGTSCPLLWDFGFAPLALFSLQAQASLADAPLTDRQLASVARPDVPLPLPVEA